MSAADHMAAFLAWQTRQRVNFDALAGAADAGDSSLAASPRRRRILAEAARTLAARGLATLPKGKDGWDHAAHPPLPRWVQRPPAARPPGRRPAPRAYVAQLAFATTMRLTTADHALLGPINALLRDQPDAEVIPLADRSYQLYGEEKHLKHIERHHLVTKGFLDLTTHLRARPTPAPLAMFELGPAPWLLIVENTAAFTSLREILGTWPDNSQVGWLVFGEGDHLIASLPTALTSFRERSHPVDTVLLYADLDLDGLRCAQKASDRARTASLPPLQPALGLYQALLAQPPRPHPPVAIDEAHTAATWLPPYLAKPLAELLATGLVLRHEALPLPHLRALLTPDALLLPQIRDGANPRPPRARICRSTPSRPEGPLLMRVCPSPDPPSHGIDAPETDPRTWHDICTTTIDAVPVECIRPSDTDRPTWCVYPPGRHGPEDYLGTLHARDIDGFWYVQATGERHISLADALRTLQDARPTARDTPSPRRC
ncbi:hypothetical protein [Streptomyces sp. RerS4]|uniref:hypothetical protein n=1 Tax=Streptomyces sp. RerS4 TaxID=2942449 RepID=UPI00201C7621|nr:hypothetical protein [Streptomyces sp. RerS4]UQW99144.1 hypothetical protein M4D82_00260 [Streptomyces sp. RerS4]